MQKLKAIVRRGALLSAAAVVATVAYIPAVPFASADALNPLTDRSLTLSSSAPGWSYTDGSGNTTYAPPNSGANGQKTGNTFDFKVSTDSSPSGTNEPIKAMTFQYCQQSAGDCTAPGDNGWTGTAPSAERNDDTLTTSDLNVVISSPVEVGDDSLTDPNVKEFSDIINTTTGNVSEIVDADGTDGNYVVYYESAPGTWTQSTGWVMTVDNNETGTEEDATATGRNNFITLKNTTGQGFATKTRVKVIFFGTTENYITNPGSGAFFVRINTYKDDTTMDDTTLVDGGVTVANVMNHSIAIQTRVLETMDFSVGTVDPFTLDSTGGAGSEYANAFGGSRTAHTPCDRILTGMTPSAPVNVLALGDQGQESSLSTDITYSTHSYWRLSSNSSAGATVYYSGVTLSNTVGDKIAAIGATKKAPATNSEQFGLALANVLEGTDPNMAVDYSAERNSLDPLKGDYENGADNGKTGVHPTVATDLTGATYHEPQLYPLAPTANYDQGAGTVNNNYNHNPAALEGDPGFDPDPITTAFAFDEDSNTIPVPIAEGDQVVDCVTGKMRYIANIAATTPAGIYTTKINYIAAPQY